MSASQHNFPIEQGSSFELSLVYKDSNDNPIDLTGWCGRLVWTADDDTTAIFLTTNANPALYNFDIIGVSGQILLQIPASVTNTYNFGSAKYDLELESDSDIYTGGGKDIRRLLYGDISLIKRHSEYTTLLDC
jgi:hypothetical protein